MTAPVRITPLSSFEAAALGVNTKGLVATGVKGKSIAGESSAPAFDIAATFIYQSYFDDLLGAQAILAQPASEPIVPSTLSDRIQVTGYGVALHPSSQTPVAIRFDTGSQQGASTTFTLKPGEIIRPHGSMNGQPGSFSGLQFGLPFGWLGGGSARLIVLRTPDAETYWTGNPELIFHRTRMYIWKPADVNVVAPLQKNWPLRFPWRNAISGTENFAQKGQAALAVTPSRTAISLRLGVLAAASTMRVNFFGSNDFGVGPATVDANDLRFWDYTWGTYAQDVALGYAGTQYPTDFVTGQMERFAADDGGIFLTAPIASPIVDQYVDVVRYGKL